jgi:phage replication-related protein YjqB (UPF0714/DUF867 family)
MKKNQRSFPLSALLGLAAAITYATPGLADPPLIFCLDGVENIEIGLLTEAIPYEEYVPEMEVEEIAELPAEPDPSDDDVRAELAYVSASLAAQLGIAAPNPDWDEPNPQIRVRITTPSAILNYWYGESPFVVARGRESSAVFTVIGVVADEEEGDLQLLVFAQEDTTDKDSGQYKLFAHDYGESGERVARALVTPDDSPADDWLDTPRAQAWPVAPSQSTFTTLLGTTVISQHFCEYDTDGGQLTEFAVQVADTDVLVMAPHGGAIEIGTGQQAIEVVEVLDADFGIDANLWRTDGQWEDDQTSTRWHITSTSISEDSFPALADVRPAIYYQGSYPFRYAVSFHGFGGADATSYCEPEDDDTAYYQVIVGGRAATDDKCLVAARILEAVDDAGFGPNALAISLRLNNDTQIEVPDSCDREVEDQGHSGTSSDNIVNRMAAEGGIQIEQSRSVRNSGPLRIALAQGVAHALSELITGPPADPCDLLD